MSGYKDRSRERRGVIKANKSCARWNRVGPKKFLGLNISDSTDQVPEKGYERGV